LIAVVCVDCLNYLDFYSAILSAMASFTRNWEWHMIRVQLYYAH
jgi:hypothetical protein